MADLVRAPAAPHQKGHNEFGALPEWDLTDLYPAPDSPELKRDLQWSKDEAKAFEADYKGKLRELAAAGTLYEAVERSEKLGDVTGRLGSYAYLRYAQNTQDPERIKFLGDLNQQITDLATGLLFWELELNAIDDATLDAALAGDARLARYRHWFAELRKAKPYQLDEKLEELFFEKSVTGAQAWNRLFDESMAALRFEVDGEQLPIESTLHLLSDRDEKRRETAFHALDKTLTQNQRLFTHITNVLAKDKEISDRWRGYKDIADSRHMANSVEREVVDALEKAVRDA
jgi:oligoendopeptidase F